MFHKIKNVTALPDYKLSVQFSEGVTKMYNVAKLFPQYPVFNIPEDEFKNVRVDAGGCGVIWSDELDLSCDELWEYGAVNNDTMQALEEYYEWQNNPQDYKTFDNFDELLSDIMS